MKNIKAIAYKLLHSELGKPTLERLQTCDKSKQYQEVGTPLTDELQAEGLTENKAVWAIINAFNDGASSVSRPNT